MPHRTDIAVSERRALSLILPTTLRTKSSSSSSTTRRSPLHPSATALPSSSTSRNRTVSDSSRERRWVISNNLRAFWVYCWSTSIYRSLASLMRRRRWLAWSRWVYRDVPTHLMFSVNSDNLYFLLYPGNPLPRREGAPCRWCRIPTFPSTLGRGGRRGCQGWQAPSHRWKPCFRFCPRCCPRQGYQGPRVNVGIKHFPKSYKIAQNEIINSSSFT